MLKRTLLIGAIGASLCGAAAAKVTNVMTGFSIGAHGGYTFGDSKVNRQITYINPNNLPLFVYKTDAASLAGKNINGGASLGYNLIFDHCVHLGVEAFMTWTDLEASREDWFTTASPNSYKLGFKQSYGGALRIGGFYKGTALIYGKVGMVHGKWKIDSYTNFVNAVRKSRSAYKNGVLVGGGFEMPINERLFFGAEWSYSHYNKLMMNHPNVANQQNQGVYNLEYKVHPAVTQVSVHVKIKVGSL